ncbi:chemotaxis protein CheX [Geoalkalibacter halelectricus]|uniref:Chemotaxis protein CheX n=1 Tax=Geoalkalibacter halelectricus TaxID=2847045 RepID=A0ABY5ZGW1_9BACT|nr:chemotaxis protein CheX [Geoalkalibacter halelectricus]MDO3378092.1 chemotaxis protein CheX [Geoalkalibacter halelectricus]UWZ78388.1 chemotaxis protein CheX [Geoalkalibacter halelectricus]
MPPEMPPHIEQAMFEAVSTTLENMAFMDIQPLRVPHDCDGHARVFRASLLVKDPLQGELCLIMPEELLREIASGIYAAPPEELPRRKLSDILTELLNTIAGLFLSRALPANQTFELGLPEITEVNCREIEPTLLQWHFQADAGHFCLSAGGDSWNQLLVP